MTMLGCDVDRGLHNNMNLFWTEIYSHQESGAACLVNPYRITSRDYPNTNDKACFWGFKKKSIDQFDHFSYNQFPLDFGQHFSIVERKVYIPYPYGYKETIESTQYAQDFQGAMIY